MKCGAVPSEWIRNTGGRLDCQPFLSGAVEARVIIESGHFELAPLRALTKGYNGGIYNGPQFKRNYVTDPGHGVRFLTTSNMLRADLSNVSYLSKKDAQSKKLSYLRLEAGTTLISCSGTIGRMVYARPDMEGMWTNQDILKVVPDPEKIPPGYLYAFLSSKFGVPLVTSGTYGAIIQHIEPEHIADLPVPRLGRSSELAIAEITDRAASLRSKAVEHRNQALSLADGLSSAILEYENRPNIVMASTIGRRLDAFHHSDRISSARARLTESQNAVPISEFTLAVWEPNRGARIKVEDEQAGLQFLSSSAIFHLDPLGEYLISKKRTPHIERLIVDEADVLIPRSGQLGGIIGRATLPLPSYYGQAASDHLVRLRFPAREDAFVAWAVLATEAGYRALTGTAFGSSIPSLDCGLISRLRIPWPKGSLRRELVSVVSSYVDCLSSAIEESRAATAMVESAIEAAA